jgi:hypothetical protein
MMQDEQDNFLGLGDLKTQTFIPLILQILSSSRVSCLSSQIVKHEDFLCHLVDMLAFTDVAVILY